MTRPRGRHPIDPAVAEVGKREVAIGAGAGSRRKGVRRTRAGGAEYDSRSADGYERAATDFQQPILSDGVSAARLTCLHRRVWHPFAWLLIVLSCAGIVARPAIAAERPRVVSLIPSLTEDLFAIGAGPDVVGVSQFTDYPPAALKLPQVSTFSSVDAEKIARLHPTVVVGIPAQAALVGDLRRLGLNVALLSDDSFEDIFSDLAALGRLTGRSHEAAALSARLRARTEELVRRVPAGPRPRVFVVLGVAPIYTVGDRSYIAHLIGLAGGRNGATGVHDAYARYSAEALVAAQPDVIVTDRTTGLPAALHQSPWSALRAVQKQRVYVLADPDPLERPGPRYNEGLAWLITQLHPHGP